MRLPLSSHNYPLWLYAGFVFLLFIVLVLRSWYVPPTQDEVISLFEYVLGDGSRLFLADSANNHFLNTWLGWLSTRCFGPTMMVFRLHSVLAFALFAFSTWKLGNMLPPVTKWLLVTGMLTAYPVFEYFAMARGYGLSFALLTSHLYCLIRYQRAGEIRHLWLAVLMISLATLANLTLLVQAVISLFILALVTWHRYRLKPMPLIPIVLLASMIAVFALVGFELRENDALYHGRKDSFIENTLLSVINMFRFQGTHPLTVSIIMLPLLAGVISQLASVRHSGRTMIIGSPYLLLLLCLGGNILASITLANFFGINYPTERVGLFYVPLFLLVVAFGTFQLDKPSPWLLSLCVATQLLLTWGITGDMLRNLSLTRSKVEPYAHLPEEVFDAVVSQSTAFRHGPPVIHAEERLSYAWRYCNFKAGGLLNPLAHYLDPAACDLVISSDIIRPGFEVVYHHIPSGLAVLKKNPPENLVLTHTKIQHVLPAPNSEFMGLSQYGPVSGEDLRLQCKVSLYSAARPRAALVISIREGAHERFYHLDRIDQLLSGDSSHVKRTWPVPACDSCEVSVYVYNIHKRPIEVRNITLNVFNEQQ